MERMNQWLTLLANLGVLIGVFVVAYELRQNTIAMEASSRQEFAAQDLAYLTTALDPSIVAVALKKIELGEPLNELELSQVKNRQHMNFRIFENAFYQYKKGTLEPQEWNRYIQIMDYLFCDDRAQRVEQMWEQFRSGFVADFASVVDQIKTDCPE
jgi:hypothetical protein